MISLEEIARKALNDEFKDGDIESYAQSYIGRHSNSGYQPVVLIQGLIDEIRKLRNQISDLEEKNNYEGIDYD